MNCAVAVALIYRWWKGAPLVVLAITALIMGMIAGVHNPRAAAFRTFLDREQAFLREYKREEGGGYAAYDIFPDAPGLLQWGWAEGGSGSRACRRRSPDQGEEPAAVHVRSVPVAKKRLARVLLTPHVEARQRRRRCA